MAGLPAVFLADWWVYPPSFWRTVLGKSGWCEEKCTPIIIRNADGARHPDHNPDHNPIHKRSVLKPWLSAVGVKTFIYISQNDLISNKSQTDPLPFPNTYLIMPGTIHHSFVLRA